MSVVDNLWSMRGVWIDHLQGHHLNGDAMDNDTSGAIPGPFPYDNLVYVDFDGERYRQTNVVLCGRPPHVRSFGGWVREGVLHFDPLGPDAPLHLGVSGGPGTLLFLPAKLDLQSQQFSDPDFLSINGDLRRRTTSLYRGGTLVRILSVSGVRISRDPSVLHVLDPRDPSTSVHGELLSTTIYKDRYVSEGPASS